MLPEKTEVLIVGGGPAGSLLGCMLARRGIEVVLAERQATVERTFRGETLVSAAITALRALGFGPALEEHGYLEVQGMRMSLEGSHVMDVDYERMKTKARYVDMPQPGLLRIINESASQEPTFTYLAGAAMTDLVEEDGEVVGATFKMPDGSHTTIRSRLVIGADGRFSKVRKVSGLEATITPMDRDVLWFKVPRPADWGGWAEFVVDRDRHVIAMPSFPNWLRVAHNLPKHGLGELRHAGLDSFKEGVARLIPRLGPLMDEHLETWNDTSYLEIFTAHLDSWARDGLVLVGDASHTCTPILGQGVNLSIQDAVLITPLISAALRREPGTKPLPASVFTEWVAGRRKHKSRVTRFQTSQENSLAVHTPLGLAARQAKFRLFGVLPQRYWVMSKVLGGEVIDPIDVRDSVAAKALVVN